MDWDPVTGTWYLLSDDRSERAPARLYTANIVLGPGGIKSLTVTSIVDLLEPNGEVFRNARQSTRPPDPEALRLDLRTGDLVWSSETDHQIGVDSFVRQTTRHGHFVKEWPLPLMLQTHVGADSGARNNQSLESLAFSPDGSALWLGMEAPLREDGPSPSLQSGGLARLTKLDRDGRLLAQYAYPIDPIPLAPTGGRMRADNGVSEILSLSNDSLLVVERAGREVEELVFKFSVRLYETRTDGATNVSQMASLAHGGFKPMSKRLLLDMNAADWGEVGNVEAAAWGPCLDRHKASLLLASDDNFSSRQSNLFMLFQVTGSPASARCP
jgi:hypothetical protein